jgi:hypothetical protein
MTNDSLEDWIDKFLETEPLPTLEFEDAELAPPLTESDLIEGQQRLMRWQSPTAFYDDTMALCASFRSRPSEFFNRQQLKFLRDAYVLAEFARLQKAEVVRLADPAEQWPDGLVNIGGMVHNVEVTSTHGGRKLGKEYRSIAEPTQENWVERADSIPKYLDDAISRKIQKNYSSPCILIVYLNINDLDACQNETEQVIAAAKVRHSRNFAAIFVLWKRHLY